ncbi:hypothetical protein [Paenibacillus ihumii]|uniref:hypothetical protein n=1 Tax=Paenibacillus ihumii TaxID=687436 RepID=UPI0011DD34EC|nr:hypothetical protein [Paenibacillus ihumii]
MLRRTCVGVTPCHTTVLQRTIRRVVGFYTEPNVGELYNSATTSYTSMLHQAIRTELQQATTKLCRLRRAIRRCYAITTVLRRAANISQPAEIFTARFTVYSGVQDDAALEVQRCGFSRVSGHSLIDG